MAEGHQTRSPLRLREEIVAQPRSSPLAAAASQRSRVQDLEGSGYVPLPCYRWQGRAGRERCHLLVGCFCLLRSKVGKAPSKWGRCHRAQEPGVEGLWSASFRDLGSMLFATGQIISPSSASPPWLCRTCGSTSLHFCASVEFLRWPQVVAEMVLEWKSPPSVAHPPTPALQRRAGKAKFCRSCRRLC